MNHTFQDNSLYHSHVMNDDNSAPEEKMFDEYFGTLLRKKGVRLGGPPQLLHVNFNDRSPSPPQATGDDRVSEQMFEEYFGNLLRQRGKRLGHRRPQSLQVPRPNEGKNYSQTLV